MERWIEIDLNPKYEISDQGNVRKKIIRRRPYRNLKHETMEHGYKRVTITIGGKYKRFSIHRLVATYFIPNPENLPFVLHLDNNPSNNHVSNLRWGTPSDNLKQAYHDKLISKQGEKNSIAVFTDDKIKAIRELSKNGYSQKKIGSMYGVNQSHISMIVNRKIWAHI